MKPGGEPSASLGIAISLNTRTSRSMGYVHTWSMGTKTKRRPIDAKTGALGELIDTTTRDLQIGRFLFGMSYRVIRAPPSTGTWRSAPPTMRPTCARHCASRSRSACSSFASISCDRRAFADRQRRNTVPCWTPAAVTSAVTVSG